MLTGPSSRADQGQPFVGGATASVDFPVTPGAFDTSFNGGEFDAFVTKLNQSGSALVYSTFVGSQGFDAAFALAAERDGRPYLTGTTNQMAQKIGAHDTEFVLRQIPEELGERRRQHQRRD